MVAQSPPFALQNSSAHSAQLFRQAVFSAWRQAGLVGPNDLAVSAQSTPNMSVQVAAGRAWMLGTQVSSVSGGDWSPQAAYFGINDAPLTVTISAADPTNPRIDLVVAYVQDSFYSGSNNQLLIGVVTGTPAPSPSAPAAPNNALAVAQVAVAANATSVTNSNITNTAGLLTVARGGILPVTSTDATAGKFTDQYRAHPTFGLQRWSGSAWVTVGVNTFPVAYARQTTAQTGIAANTFAVLAFQTVDIDTAAAFSGTTFTVPSGQGGTYAVEGSMNMNANNSLVDIRVLKNGSPIPAGHGVALITAQTFNITTGRHLLSLNAGDTLSIAGYSNGGPWSTYVPAAGDGGSWVAIERIR